MNYCIVLFRFLKGEGGVCVFGSVDSGVSGVS